jgi:prophage regulatory protein
MSRAQKKSQSHEHQEQSAKESDSQLPHDGLVPRRVVLAYASTSKSTIYRWIKQGTFPAAIRTGSGSSRWHVADLRAWMEKIRGGAA